MSVSNLIKPFARSEGPPPRRLWPFMRWALAGSWPVIIISCVISSLTGVVEVATALVLGRIVDSAVVSDPATYLADNWALVLAFAVVFLFARPVTLGLSALATSVVVAPNLVALTQSRLHRWTLGQSVTFFDNDFAGRIAQKQIQTANSITDVAVEVINVVAFALASIIGSTLLLLAIDGRVAGLLAIWTLAYFALISWFLPRIKARANLRASARAAVTGQVVDTITNIKVVKLFANSRHEDEAALGAMGTLRQKALDFGWLATAFRFALMLLAGSLPVLLIGTTLYLWAQGSSTPGDIAAAGSVSIRLAQMTGWVSFTLMGIYSNIGEIEDGMNTLAQVHTVTDRKDARPIAMGAGEISYEGVGFHYGQGRNGVTGIDLTIAPGEKLGLVGASGAGKSTLVSLLLRLYDPEEGRILIDGQQLRDLQQESFRAQIGMVTQETAMFNRSARDNIRYGRPDAPDAELIAASKAAEAHDFIQDLTDFNGRTGYDAHLGERGVKLSGGQRQRIALARAILKDAPILVLDEATSALDSEVEASIQAALETVMQGKTVLAIAHRLSTLSRMDRIIVMDQGRIVEEGTHDTLLEQGGLYATYWQRQSGGFIGIQDAAE